LLSSTGVTADAATTTAAVAKVKEFIIGFKYKEGSY